MKKIELSKLYFSKTHIETGVEFRDYFSTKMCPLWNKTPFEEMNMLAEQRIKTLNDKQNTWRYEIVG